VMNNNKNSLNRVFVSTMCCSCFVMSVCVCARV